MTQSATVMKTERFPSLESEYALRSEGSFTLMQRLTPQMLRAACDICDWVMTLKAETADAGLIISGLAERLNEAGIPVDRITTAIEILHSDYAGVVRFWVKGEGLRMSYYPHVDVLGVYEASPFYHVHQSGEWLHLDVTQTPDDRFNIIPELKADGYTFYICIPIFFSIGTRNGMTFATQEPLGFTDEHLDLLRFIMPTVGVVMEMMVHRRTMNTVLRMYVGDEPSKAILGGTIQRGDVSRIRSAILFADMRNYTHLSSTLTPEETVVFLNDYFDCLVPSIEKEGGEVLKYMGDGLLAIFRDRGDDTGSAAQAAFVAAQGALAQIDAVCGARKDGAPPIEAGIALHHGDAAYGNVGSGTRLDFTVIGRDVNIASRLARLNKTLHEPLLMSKAFANHLWNHMTPVGSFKLDGIEQSVDVYKP